MQHASDHDVFNEHATCCSGLDYADDFFNCIVFNDQFVWMGEAIACGKARLLSD